MTVLAVVALMAQAKMYEGLGQGWLGEFELATRQLIQLAEATPPEKYSFRPAPGVRSTSENFMHVAITNYVLIAKAGLKPGGAGWPSKIEIDTEKKITAKAEVLKWLKDSVEVVRKAYPAIDHAKIVEFRSADEKVPAANLLLRILAHNHEHMGQAIAYARMSGVKPPWSR